jgi:exopolyphosphatase/guanosine-5'-triphosphate,3'-diphosphate pyrophosphatase
VRVAALDLGTNTFILLIADVEDGRVIRVIHDEVRVVRLGQGVHESRRLHPEALARAEECFKDFAAVIARHGVERTLACATSAARDVANADALIGAAARHGIPVQVISGNQEAELTFAGTLPDALEGSILIIDVGGGSTEYILGDRHGIKARKSIDVGSVRLTELFVTSHPVLEQDMAAMEQYIRERLAAAKAVVPLAPGAKIIAVAGTPTTVAAVDQGRPFDYEHVHGYVLTRETLSRWVRKFKSMTVAERQALSGMDPKRADVIVAGSLILDCSLREYGAGEMEVSVRGLRYGIASAVERGQL